MFQRLKTRKPIVLQGYVDTDYAGDLNPRRSTKGLNEHESRWRLLVFGVSYIH